LLNLLLWSVDTLARPTFRNLSGSYEGWIYRNGLVRQTARLQSRKLIERKADSPGDRLYRLTSQGRLKALGGRDPDEQWDRRWDGQWRLVIFDVPVRRNAERERLRRHLRRNNFGCLQNSVWVTPDPMDKERQILLGEKADVEALILLKARPCAGETDREIVAGAWDFQQINRRYSQYLKVLGQQPTLARRDDAAAKGLLSWARQEREAWLDAVTNDPLLPARLLPVNYLGRRAWRRRMQMLLNAGRQLRSFKAPPRQSEDN
jgi:phenylacetic acid degradation operon negative regulatory protein